MTSCRPRKRLLIGLLAAGLLVLAGALVALGVLALQRPDVLSSLLWRVALAIALITLPILGIGLLGLVVSLMTGRAYPKLTRPIRATVDTLWPIALTLGRVLGVKRDAIFRSFIEINNRLAGMIRERVEPRRLLILLPRCMQATDCQQRLDASAANCQRCGRCRIGDIMELGDRRGALVCVATGGGQARQAVSRIRPRAVIAVACEHELVSGLQDVRRIPVLAVLNSRPYGPCVDTDADIGEVALAVHRFLGGDKDAV